MASNIDEVITDSSSIKNESEWLNVTAMFVEATKELNLGELLHDETFGLLDAMSALEMMDPKMDAGMAYNRDKKILNIEQAIKEGKIKVKDITNSEKIGIIDDTFGCLISWLEGHHLAQTVFTNLYLHDPSLIEDKCIKSFSRIILKLVDIIKEFVGRANVVEEEDFLSGYPHHIPCDISDSKALAMIRDIEEDYQRKLKSTAKNQNKNFDKNSINSTQNDNANNSESETINNYDQRTPELNELSSQQFPRHQEDFALYARIKFCRLFFQSLLNLKKEVIVKSNNSKKLPLLIANIEETDKYLQQSNETIQIWKKTLDLGIRPEHNLVSNSKYRRDYPTIMGFEPLINQRLLPPTFPRYTKMKTREEAVEFLECLIQRLRHVCKIYYVQSYHSALDFFTEFSRSSSSSSCVLSRSILQVLYIPGFPLANKIFGISPLSELLREDVKCFIRPPSLYQRPSILHTYPQAKECLEIFFTRCIKPMFFLIQINGHNRARQRDKLAQVLEELASLQYEADRVDNFLNLLYSKQETSFSHLGYLSTWVLYHILRVMIQYLLSGFELELYSVHEYSYIYWYLYEFLFNWMVSTLNRARTFIADQETLQEQKSRNSKKIRPKKRKQKPHQKEWLFNQALQQLCGGYFRTVCAFRLQGKLKLPWCGLHGERIRYEHRFMPFNVVISPPPVSYSQYKEMTDYCLYEMKDRTNELYLTACKCFQQAKSLLETIPDQNDEINSLIKVAKTNFIVIKLLLSGHKGDDETLPQFDFRLNNKFPVIRIL